MKKGVYSVVSTCRSHATGYGKFFEDDGEFYEGRWLDDRKHGQGMHRLANGAVYTGQFKNNVKCGKGSEKWPDGATFEEHPITEHCATNE